MKHLACIFLLLGLFTRLHAQRLAAMENFVREYGRKSFSPRPKDDSINTFQVIINHTTTLHDLMKIQKKVFRKLGISLSYRTIDFDSAGLCGISIEARKGSVCYPTATCTKLKDISDFGIFGITIGDDKVYYIGTKSDWIKTAIPSSKPNPYLSNL